MTESDVHGDAFTKGKRERNITMKYKRILACLLAVSTMGACLTGCKSKKTENPSSEETTSDSSSEEETESTTTKAPTKEITSEVLKAYSEDIVYPVSEDYKEGTPLNMNLSDEGVNFDDYRVCAAAMSEDGIWCIAGERYMIHFDSEGNRLAYYDLGTDTFYFSIRMLYDEATKNLYLLVYGEEDIEVYAFDTTTATLRHLFVPDDMGPAMSEVDLMGIDNGLFYFRLIESGMSSTSSPGRIVVCDETGKIVKYTDSIPGLKGGWIHDGELYGYVMDDPSQDQVILFDADGKIDQNKIVQARGEVYDMFFQNGHMYLSDVTGIWTWDPENLEWTLIFDWNNGADSSRGCPCAVSPDDQQFCSYVWSDPEGPKLYSPIDNPYEGKKIIRLSGLMWESDPWTSLVEQFNAENPDYYAEIIYPEKVLHEADYTGSMGLDFEAWYNAYIEYIENSITDGQGPVIFLQEDLFYYSLASSISNEPDLWMDLLPRLKEDPLFQEELLPGVAEWINGQDDLRFFPYKVTALEMYGDYSLSALTDGRAKYTSVLNHLKQGQYNMLSAGLSSEEFLRYALCNDLDYFVGEDGTLRFDDPEFRALLEICKEYLFSLDNTHYPNNSKDAAYVDMSEIVRLPVGGGDYFDPHSDFTIGFPSATESETILIPLQSIRIGQPSCQEDEDAAWVFLQYMLTHTCDVTYSGLHELQDCYEFPEEHLDYWYGYAPPACDHEWIRRNEEWATGLDRVIDPFDPLVLGIEQELQMYFKGNASIDDTIAAVEGYVTKYLSTH